MIDIKIGETYTTPGGMVIKARREVDGCATCIFNGFAGLKRMREHAKLGCIDVRCTGRIFDEVVKSEETSAPSIPLPSLAKMERSFKLHVLSVARAEFVALFWDMPNTDLAAAMGVTEKTVRNIRKKRLRKNKESI